MFLLGVGIAKRQWARGKHSMVATGAVARRLVHMIYSVWSQNRPFDPNYRRAPSGRND